MNQNSQDQPTRQRKILPPVVLLAAILASVAIDRWLPLAQLWDRPWAMIGVAIMVVALGINIFCALEFRRRKTSIIPFQQSTSLITGGLYQVSRNPIYLSMAMLLCGLAIFLGSLSPWLVPPVFVVVISDRFIFHEEAMLRDAFGDTYQEYCGRVRRWL